MFATDQAPGVYYQTVDAGSPPATPLRTDIAAFIGIAERGPVGMPVPIESWQQFVSWFGGCTAAGYLAYSVRGFLENGGRRCWVVRVASDDPITGAAWSWAELSDSKGPVWQVSASSPGVWGDQLGVVVREVNRTQVYGGQSPDGRWCSVPNLSGFTRATLMRISQEGSPTVSYRTVSAIDPASSRVYWTHPEPGAGLPYDAPVDGFDPDRPLLLQSVGYRLLVSEEGRLLRIYDGLSVVPEHPRYGPTVLAALCSADTTTSPEPVVLTELRSATTTLTVLRTDPAATVGLAGGRDGLASLTVLDFIGDPFALTDESSDSRPGLQAISDLDEVALVAIPDIHIQPLQINPTVPPPPCVPDPCLDEPPLEPGPRPSAAAEVPPKFSAEDVYRVQAAIVLHCEQRRDRFALLDAPHHVVSDILAATPGMLDWRGRFDTAFAAINYPWLKVADPAQGTGAIRVIPASGHVAGIFAHTDLQFGVHRAPANQQLQWALGASGAVSAEHHAVLNTAGVNVIRTPAGRGLRLLGARTLSSDPDWVFLNVRRLMSMVEKALSIGLQWATFEPNGFLTRARATMTVSFFLDALHEAGMLAGATAEESYFVRCDLDNNPPEQRDVGQLVVEVGVAPVQPFEFIVVRVGRVGDTVGVRGSSTDLGAMGTGI